MMRDEVAAHARELDERELTVEEFERRVRLALADTREIEERAALVAWFVRRYPTPRERLAYARRKYRQLMESPLRASVGSEGDGDGDPPA
jgi:hypothetical protein